MIAYGETLGEARAQAAEELTGWIDACESLHENSPSRMCCTCGWYR